MAYQVKSLDAAAATPALLLVRAGELRTKQLYVKSVTAGVRADINIAGGDWLELAEGQPVLELEGREQLASIYYRVRTPIAGGSVVLWLATLDGSEQGGGFTT